MKHTKDTIAALIAAQVKQDRIAELIRKDYGDGLELILSRFGSGTWWVEITVAGGYDRTGAAVGTKKLVALLRDVATLVAANVPMYCSAHADDGFGAYREKHFVRAGFRHAGDGILVANY